MLWSNPQTKGNPRGDTQKNIFYLKLDLHSIGISPQPLITWDRVVVRVTIEILVISSPETKSGHSLNRIESGFRVWIRACQLRGGLGTWTRAWQFSSQDYLAEGEELPSERRARLAREAEERDRRRLAGEGNIMNLHFDAHLLLQVKKREWKKRWKKRMISAFHF